jgi:hypothetical protein
MSVRRAYASRAPSLHRPYGQPRVHEPARPGVRNARSRLGPSCPGRQHAVRAGSDGWFGFRRPEGPLSQPLGKAWKTWSCAGRGSAASVLELRSE